MEATVKDVDLIMKKYKLAESVSNERFKALEELGDDKTSLLKFMCKMLISIESLLIINE